MNDLEFLQATWQSSSTTSTGTQSLRGMTKARKHPALRRLRFKFLIEAGDGLSFIEHV